VANGDASIPGEPAVHPALLPDARRDLRSARAVAATCTACDLWSRATQTVFGEGPGRAPLFLLGEQPGDREDIEGHPFVGPAGELLGRALDDAGIRREDAFVSNVVKHFKWKPQGKRRLHERPNAGEIRACRPWLDLELELVRPDVLVLLGATAATAVLGRAFRLTESRGTLIEADGGEATTGGPARIATFHPSAVLRARDAESRRTTYEALVADLTVARQRLAG
jgi:DNA polymerase